MYGVDEYLLTVKILKENTVPSLKRNLLEGVTTKIYRLNLIDMPMKSVHME